MWMSFRLVRDFHPVHLIEMLENVAQRNEDFDIDNTLRVTVNIVSVPAGKGRVPLTREDVHKKSILTIKNTDNLCLPRSLVTAHVHAIRGQIRTGKLHDRWNKIRASNGKYQRECAQKLVNIAKVKIPESGCGIEEIKKFQEHYVAFGIAIVVYAFSGFGKGDKPLYDGTELVLNSGSEVRRTLRIMYYENANHYQPILNVKAAAGSRGYCLLCNKTTANERSHRCTKKCFKCMANPPCSFKTKKKECSECCRSFFGEQCYENHLKLIPPGGGKMNVCQSIKICQQCHKTARYSEKESHECEVGFCKMCQKKSPLGHLCYMQPLTSQDEKVKTLYLFYDFETQQSVSMIGNEKIKIHVPNLCIVHQVCSYCIENEDVNIRCDKCGVRRYVFKSNPVKQLIDLAIARRSLFRKTICIAHNAQAFDVQFILKYITENKVVREKPNLIMRGSKIILMELLQAKFIDSYNYMSMPLSALPKAYGLTGIDKGTFPHYFNTPENAGYVGTMPPVDSYAPESMNRKEREEFLRWYNEKVNEGHEFRFQEELEKYCDQDVKILRLACLAFRKSFLECGNIDPFVVPVTIASACMRVFRKNFLKEDTVGIVPRGGYRHADKQSQKAIKWLIWMEKVLERTIQHAENCREKRLPEGPVVDGYCEPDESAVRGIVLQFHGCYYHGCPKCFTINRQTTKYSGNESMDDKYERTMKVSKIIRSANYKLIEVWECEFDKEYKQNLDMREYISEKMLGRHEPLDPRDAFFGGRTGNTVKAYDIQEQGEQIKYLDFCSLYPYICKYGRYPIGHPKLYVGEKECGEFIGDDLNNLVGVDGLIKCEVLPPQNLYFPVLPVKMHNRLMFPLCRTCVEVKNKNNCLHDVEERVFTGTWVVDEVKVAIREGYTVRKIFEIWQYEMTVYNKKTNKSGIFAEYVDKFFAEKTYASGYPTECTDEESKVAHIRAFEKHEGIKLDESRRASTQD